MGLSHIYYKNAELEFNIIKTAPLPQVLITYQGCTTDLCYPPITKTLNLKKITSSESATNASATVESTSQDNKPKDEAESLYQEIKGHGFLLGMLAFFVLGLLLSLTPCMFPMYPIWSAIILGGRKKNFATAFSFSFAYIQGMAITYMLIGFALASAGAKFHAFTQQPIVLIAISVLFIVLALSMFGVFNIALPNSLTTKLQNLSDKQKGGSFIGVFIMGVISAIVASPCTTAPLAGALMFIIQDGNMIKGGIYLYILALGMGTPLFIFGLLGQKYLPRSGNWTQIIKTLCGFIMLSVPIILLQNFLPKWLIIVHVILIATATISYLFYVLSKTHKKIFTSVCAITGIVLSILGGLSVNTVEENSIFKEVMSVNDLEAVLNSQNEVILDLRADWCRECKHYENTTFKDSKVQAYLKTRGAYFADVTSQDSSAFPIMQKYEVTGIPAILVFQNGKLTKKISGYHDAEDFLKLLNE